MEAESVKKNLNSIAIASFLFFLGIIISKGMNYAYRIIIARHFGAEDYGLFSLGIMVAGWFMAFSTFGLNEGILRFTSFYRGRDKKEEIKYLFRFSIKTLLLTSFISGIILYLLSDFISINLFHNPLLSNYLKYFSILVPALVMAHPFLGMIRSFEKIGAYSFIFNVLQSVIKVILIALLIFVGFKSYSIIFSHIIGTIVMVIASIIFCFYTFNFLFKRPNLKDKQKKKIRSEVLHYSIPLLFTSIISTIFYWVDTFSLGYYKTATIVGYYNAAIPISLLLAIAPELMIQLFFPIINKEYSRNKISNIRQLSQQVGKWIFILNIPLFILLIFFPGALLNLLFGTDYLVAIGPLRILSIAALIASMFGISSQLISMTGRSKVSLFNVILCSGINILLNAILIPMNKIGPIDNSDGLNGAAIATLISITLLYGLYIFQAYYYLRIIPVRRKHLTITISGLLAGFVLLLLSNIIISRSIVYLAFMITIFLVTYLLSLIILRAFDENDISIIKTTSKKAASFIPFKNYFPIVKSLDNSQNPVS
jgi:O-antigen/teichoic acid export membrane protein